MDLPLSQRELRDLLSAGYRYSCALRNNPADAQDLVQEAWLRVVQAYGARPSQAVLLRTIRNIHIDQYRHLKRFQHVSIDDTVEHLSDTDATAAVLDVGDPLLNRCLSRLCEKEREALFLSVVEGYTAEEIARMTHKPRGTVLSLIHRARLKLKNYLLANETRAREYRSQRQQS